MTTKVEKSIEVDAPISAVYNQWTQFEDFPQFMGGVSTVTQLDDNRLHWVAEIAGVKREWDATILEQVPDEKVAWAATEGATNAGAVFFHSIGADRTSVRLSLEYEPEGIVEKAGDKLNIIEKQAQSDLEKFKTFIEKRGYESGGWRGTVNEGAGVGAPGVEAAASSKGDSGKSGVSAKAVIAGVAAGAAGVAAASALKSKSGDSDTETDEVEVETVAYETDSVVDAPAAYATETTYVGTDRTDIPPAGTPDLSTEEQDRTI
ncbi:MAG TPA: SRPBCC family protein [Nocardioidaceae bacterium]|nr:SRPBCC family protein [Nocardioidaceae bacterium]